MATAATRHLGRRGLSFDRDQWQPGVASVFVQAAPALALAAGVAGAIPWPATRVPVRLRPVVRMAGVLLLAIAAWRVADFAKIPRNASHDLAYLTGQASCTDHLARFGGRQDDKYIALAIARLAEYLSSCIERPTGSTSSGSHRRLRASAAR